MGANSKPDPDSRRILDSIRRIVRALRESSRETESTLGLSAAQLFVLQKLQEAAGISLNELAARTLTHQSTVSVVVAKLVERGLVRRTRSSQDARRLVLSLTDEGRKVIGTAAGAAQERLVAGIAGLETMERQRLARSLGRLAAAIEAPAGRPPMFFEEEPARRRKEVRKDEES